MQGLAVDLRRDQPLRAVAGRKRIIDGAAGHRRQRWNVPQERAALFRE
jgi:hypothetical protein